MGLLVKFCKRDLVSIRVDKNKKDECSIASCGLTHVRTYLASSDEP